MKTLFLLFSAFCFSLISFSQITITSSDIVEVGDSIFMSIDIMPNNAVISVGGDGNQNWDFSSLEEHTIDSILLIHPDDTPYFGSFPTSNITAFVLPDSIYAFVTKNEFGLYQDGIVADINGDNEPEILVSERSDLMIALPANYNMMVHDTAISEIILGSQKLNQTVYIKDTIDAYGNLTIPAGTFSSLRKFRQNILLDSLFSNALGDWTLISASRDTTYEYEWWTSDPSIKFYLCSFEYDIDVDTIIGDISHIKGVSLSGIESISDVNNYLIYPNPGKGVYTIKNDFHKIDFVEVIDCSGRLIKHLFPKDNECSVDISDRTKGIYFFRLKSGDSIDIHKVVLN